MILQNKMYLLAELAAEAAACGPYLRVREWSCEVHLTLLSLVTCIRPCMRLHDGERDFSILARGPTGFTGVTAHTETTRR